MTETLDISIRPRDAQRPSELALTLATLPGDGASRYGGHRDGWVYADEVRTQLRRLGFTATPQQIAAWLGRMARVECPWVEVRTSHGIREYRVTRFGATDIFNRLPGVSARTPWLPTMRGTT